MKKMLLLSVLFCCPVWLMAQINLDIKNKKISFFKALESQNKSKQIKNKSNYINRFDVNQPIIYRRKQANLPDLLVYYYTIKKDSTIDYILYEWQDTSTAVMAQAQMKYYFNKYNELVAQISAKYGRSQSDGNLKDSSLIEKDYLRQADWWTNDAAYVEAYVVLSNKHSVMRNIRVLPTHTIRVFVRTPSIEHGPQALSRDKAQQLDDKVQLFLKGLFMGDFDDSRKFIAPKVAARVNDEQFDKLKEAIQNDTWQLDQNGKQVAVSGKLYTSLRYVRRADTAKQALDILNILFDDDDKIIAVQPFKKTGIQ